MKRAAVVSILLILISTHAQATLVQRLTLDEMIQKAQTIVQGRVRSVNTHWSDNGKLILTSYTIDVEDAIKGQPGKTMEITLVGGKIGNLILYAAGMPAFDAGDQTVLFVEKSGAGISTIVGLSQGKFDIRNGEVANTVSELSFPDGRAGVPTRMRLDDFKRQIKSRIR